MAKTKKDITREMFDDFDFDIRRFIMKQKIRPKSINYIEVSANQWIGDPNMMGCGDMKKGMYITIKFTIELE